MMIINRAILTLITVIVFFIPGIKNVIAASECAAILSPDFQQLHIPELNINNTLFQAELQRYPATDGSMIYRVDSYSVKDRGQCNADSAFLVRNSTQSMVFLPKLTYGVMMLQADLTFMTQSDGVLLLKLNEYRQGELFNGEGGAMIAASQFELLSVSDSELKYRQRFSFGAEVEMSLSLQPRPTDLNSSLVYNRFFIEDFSADFSYAIPYRALPQDVASRILAVDPKIVNSVDSGSLVVMVRSVFKSGGKNALEALVNSAFGTTAADVAKVGGNMLNVMSAVEISEDHNQLVAELDALAECAKNPPIPTSSGNIQNRIAVVKEAQLQVKINTANFFLMQGATKAASLTPTTSIWTFLSGTKNYMNNASKSLSKEALRVAQQSVPCQK